MTYTTVAEPTVPVRSVGSSAVVSTDHEVVATTTAQRFSQSSVESFTKLSPSKLPAGQAPFVLIGFLPLILLGPTG